MALRWIVIAVALSTLGLAAAEETIDEQNDCM
jgi:hypothetical protein